MAEFVRDKTVFFNFIFSHRWKKYCFWNTTSQIIQWASAGLWNGIGKCWTNIDKEVIKFVGYIIAIRKFRPIVFELDSVDWHSIAAYNRFDDIPKLFHVTFVSGKQFLRRILFSHLNQILQFVLVCFISMFIIGRFNLFGLLIQFVFFIQWNFATPQTTRVFYFCIYFYPIYRKAPAM